MKRRFLLAWDFSLCQAQYATSLCILFYVIVASQSGFVHWCGLLLGSPRSQADNSRPLKRRRTSLQKGNSNDPRYAEDDSALATKSNIPMRDPTAPHTQNLTPKCSSGMEGCSFETNCDGGNAALLSTHVTQKCTLCCIKSHCGRKLTSALKGKSQKVSQNTPTTFRKVSFAIAEKESEDDDVTVSPSIRTGKVTEFQVRRDYSRNEGIQMRDATEMPAHSQGTSMRRKLIRWFASFFCVRNIAQ